MVPYSSDIISTDKTAHTADISPARGGISAVWADFSSKKLSWPRRILARVLACADEVSVEISDELDRE